jgi:hypothetical protein
LLCPLSPSFHSLPLSHIHSFAFIQQTYFSIYRLWI